MMRTVLVALVVGTACAPAESPLTTRLREAGPIVVAHRGGMDLAPEHTLLAFERAWEAGADVIELDVRRTDDGVHYLFHDDTLDRTTDGEGSVFGRTWDELRDLDAGHDWTRDGGQTYPERGTGLRIATLEEALAHVPDAVWNLDVKSRVDTAPAEVAELVRAAGAEDRVCIGSFDEGIARAFRQELPDACTYHGEGSTRWLVLDDLLPVASAAPPRFDVLAVPVQSAGIRVVDRGFVRRAHHRDQLVWVWTVNEADEMDALLELGVDGLITDEVQLALERTDRR